MLLSAWNRASGQKNRMACVSELGDRASFMLMILSNRIGEALSLRIIEECRHAPGDQTLCES